MGSLTAGVLMFDYIVWTRKYHRRPITLSYLILRILCVDLLTLDDTPLSARSCHGVLRHEACRLTPADLFLVSISIWSTLQLVWSAMIVVNYAGALWNTWRRGFRNLLHDVAAVAT